MAKNKYDDLFAEADAAFTGKYQQELNELKGLSKEEIDALIPKTTDSKIYLDLINAVDQASKDNLSQAQLIHNIKELGDVAVKIAKKIPKFAALL